MCYRIDQMLNFVTSRQAKGAAVPIRACESIADLATIEWRHVEART